MATPTQAQRNQGVGGPAPIAHGTYNDPLTMPVDRRSAEQRQRDKDTAKRIAAQWLAAGGQPTRVECGPQVRSTWFVPKQARIIAVEEI